MHFQNKNENFRKPSGEQSGFQKISFSRDKWEIRDTNELAENILV